MGVGGQRHAKAALPPGMTGYPLYRRLGGPQGRSGRVWKVFPPPGLDPRTVQPVASRYTDYTILVHRQTNNNNNIVDKIASNAWLSAGELFPETA